MQPVYITIFSFSRGYNFLNRQVCREFRMLTPKTDGLDHLEQLIKDGKKPNSLCCSERLLERAVERELFCVIEESCRELQARFKSLQLSFEGNLCKIATKKGKVKVLNWACENGFYCDASICEEAANYGHLEVLKWGKDKGYQWGVTTCLYACSNGHLEILKWVVDGGQELVHWFFSNAASGGHIHILEWLKEELVSRGKILSQGDRTSYSKLAYHNAVYHGHKETALWLEKNGFC
ncbi:ankyrin repeat [Cedratvirus lausannensis]|uniref:Ankyrin repeat n=1 Tax=Cedratvirus lausannensis TaxID=2023205 RepID=A0A285PY17_9VIRU|nr:ankyrin repeat [Cedratvirus lausannensis]